MKILNIINKIQYNFWLTNLKIKIKLLTIKYKIKQFKLKITDYIVNFIYKLFYKNEINKFQKNAIIYNDKNKNLHKTYYQNQQISKK